MIKYIFFIKKSFYSQFIYRSANMFNFFGACLDFFIQVSLWTALIGFGMKRGINLNEMICYIMINTFVLTLTRANIATELEPEIRDGSVSMHFIRPISFQGYLFSNILGKNLYKMLTTVVPIILLGSIFIGVPLPPNSTYFVLFVFSCILGMLIMFELTYIFGLLAFWVQRTWYLSCYLDAGTIFFGGTMVPLWFYPKIISDISYLLPFRYISFEAVNFYLGKTPLSQVGLILSMSLAWAGILICIGQWLWFLVTKKLTVNGG